jgi:hypothetical protein
MIPSDAAAGAPETDGLFRQFAERPVPGRGVRGDRPAPQHTYQILTKRAERLPQYFSSRRCPPNVWLGVSVEGRAYGLPRIDHLRQVDADVRFLPIEPLLEAGGSVIRKILGLGLTPTGRFV